jgi:acetyltransferase-like isoleucine patch superfamily enzyme
MYFNYLLIITYKIIKKIALAFYSQFSWLYTYFKFYLNGVKFKKFQSNGIPYVCVNLKGKFSIDNLLILNNGKHFNPIGRQQRCYFIVGENAFLKIGHNVGISCSAIICNNKITIGNNVKIGGNVVIYDTDFHSLDFNDRNQIPEKLDTINTSPVSIKNGVFIGAHTTILKGVTIGENSIIAACSVVTKDIPENQIWGGNPSKFLRQIH